jgi:adenylosuccinate lyase
MRQHLKMNSNFSYQSPLSNRYASKEMSSLFSEESKYTTWRKLWIALAKAQHALGLPISQSQIDSMIKNLHELDLECRFRIRKAIQARRNGPHSHVW